MMKSQENILTEEQVKEVLKKEVSYCNTQGYGLPVS